MATYVFENMTQAQANAVAAGDVIAFSTTTVNARNIQVAISATTDTLQAITLTVGTKSLSFGAQALSDISEAGDLVFNDNSALRLGTNNVDAATDFDPSAAQPNTIYGFGGGDTISVATFDTESFVYGGGGADVITGGTASDHLYGFSSSGGASDGADTINGGAGSDYIQGNGGNDTLDGNAGSDRINGGSGDDSISDTGGGNDTVNGNTGDDQIDGGAGNDLLRGGQGNDSVVGGAGNDTLLGDLGNDTLRGGADVDLLQGGAGNDVFAFGTTDAAPFTVPGATVASQFETILDYTDGVDQFRITGSGASSNTLFGAASSDVVRGSSDAVFNSITAATAYAQQLLDNNASTSDVAAVKVGTDVYLFWGSAGGASATINNIVKLQGVTDVSLIVGGGTSPDFLAV